MLKKRTDGVRTETSDVQAECEVSCEPFYRDMDPESSVAAAAQARGILNKAMEICLLRPNHIAYLRRGLEYLPAGYVCLDASRAWIVYWTTHGLTLLGEDYGDLHARIIDTLARFRSSLRAGERGLAYGGGPQQMPHCAPTYAAVLSLVNIGTPEALASIDRGALYRFFLSVKDAASGGFRMHHMGEIDIRGTYTVVAVAKLLNILTPELARGVAEYAASCQTYEGGFGGEPGNEAHGGYAFCAMAALVILEATHLADLDALADWCSNCQLRFEGGFQGRTNKLVDGCYSMWQGAVPAMLQMADPARFTAPPGAGGDGDGGSLVYDQRRLQRYVFYCCQQIDGGLRDKPGKSRDHYHSAYTLSGVSVAQHFAHPGEPPVVVGDAANLVARTSPVYNVRQDRADAAIAHFAGMEGTHGGLMSL